MKDEVKPGETFDHRAGVAGPVGVFSGWAGMMPDLDPGSLPVNRLALGLNCRFEGGQVRTRPGLELLSITPPPWQDQNPPTATPHDFVEKIKWIGTHHMQSKPPLLWYSTYTAGELIVGAYNPDADLLYASKTFATTLGGPSRLASFGGDVYTVASGQLFKVNPKRNDPILVTELTGAGRCLTAFGGRLWVGTSEYWDGVSVVPVTPSLGITSACVWRDVYLVGIEQSSDYVYGTYDGVWTVAALPGTVNNLYGNAVVEYREAVYVASGGTDIYKVVPGVSTAVAHSCPTGSKVMALSVMGDFLFYAYTLYDGGNSTNLIGIHDPEGSSTQWVDDHKTLTEPSLATGEVRALVTFKNRLYLSTQYETGTHTLSCDATSSWYAVDDAPPAVSGLMVGV